MSMSPVIEALVSGVTDWRVNLLDPSQSVTFPGQQRVSAHLLPFAERLAREVRTYIDRYGVQSSFLVHFDTYRFRMQLVRPNVFAARKVQLEVPELDNLGFRAEQVETLASADLSRNGGLVVLFGTTGAGKTTTASATVVARLKRHGGYCMTVENPPEHNLEGFHGDAGFCEQMDASKIGYEQALVDALRCFPSGKQSMLMLGEIRSSEEAYELIQIALDGHLVITTMHAKDIISGLTRLISLAGSRGEQEVRRMLASSLTLAVHQSIVNNTPNMQMLRMNQTSSAIIQHGTVHLLQDEILKQNKVVERRGFQGSRQGFA